jgi:hypothetical protein
MKERKSKRRYVRFTRWRRRRFFALLAESGNVRVACELSGVGLGCVYRLRQTEPGFVALMAAAVAAADEKLALRQAQDRREGEEAPPPASSRSPSPANAGDDLEDGDLVIRRGIGGRLRAMAAGTRWWAARHDAVFLGYLRATGNVTHAARAAGFTKKAAYDRRKRMPSFARAWDEALPEAERRLSARQAAEAQTAAATMEPGAYEPDDPAAFDVDLAIRMVQRWQGERARQDRAARR